MNLTTEYSHNSNIDFEFDYMLFFTNFFKVINKQGQIKLDSESEFISWPNEQIKIDHVFLILSLKAASLKFHINLDHQGQITFESKFETQT